MTPKKVWGVIIIVLGVGLIISGFSFLNDMTTLDVFKSGAPIVKTSSTNSFVQIIQVQDTMLASRHALVSGLLCIVIGICFSIGGTFLLKDKAFVSNK